MFSFLFWKKDLKKEIIMLDHTFIDIKENKLYLKEHEQIDLNKIIIIKIWTESCSACVSFRQPLKNFELSNRERVETYEFDISSSKENQNIANMINILFVPSNLIFENGLLVNIIPWAWLWPIANFLWKELWIRIE